MTEARIKTFKVGQTYSTRSIGDHNCIISITVVRRTKCFIWTDEGKKFKATPNYDGTAECVAPWGSFSMSPTIYASDAPIEKSPVGNVVSVDAFEANKADAAASKAAKVEEKTAPSRHDFTQEQRDLLSLAVSLDVVDAVGLAVLAAEHGTDFAAIHGDLLLFAYADRHCSGKHSAYVKAYDACRFHATC